MRLIFPFFVFFVIEMTFASVRTRADSVKCYAGFRFKFDSF